MLHTSHSRHEQCGLRLYSVQPRESRLKNIRNHLQDRLSKSSFAIHLPLPIHRSSHKRSTPAMVGVEFALEERKFFNMTPPFAEPHTASFVHRQSRGTVSRCRRSSRQGDSVSSGKFYTIRLCLGYCGAMGSNTSIGLLSLCCSVASVSQFLSISFLLLPPVPLATCNACPVPPAPDDGPTIADCIDVERCQAHI